MFARGFDHTDVDADLERLRRLEAQLRKARTIAARGFAQGYTAALEDSRDGQGNTAEWLHYYGERSDA